MGGSVLTGISGILYPEFAIKYLTSLELIRLENLQLMGNSTLQKALDIFLFSVYTGLRFRDAQFLTIDNIDKSSSSSDFIITKQEKTDDLVEIPILKPTQIIMDKYNNSEDRLKKKNTNFNIQIESLLTLDLHCSVSSE